LLQQQALQEPLEQTCYATLSYPDRPIYCDTDSIICEAFGGNLHDTELGGWKIEAEGDYAAIAGKKLYAVFDNGKGAKES
jgi:hypothetical protein